MKTKNIFKTISIFAFSITAVIVLSVVLSGAWFTDDKGASTTITVGKEVKVTIDSSDVEAGALVLPGERVDFNSISIEVPETAANCYIRLTVSSNSTDFVLDSQTTLTGESSYSWIKQGKYFYLTPSSVTTLSAVPESSQLTEASANTTYKLNISNILVNSALNLNDAGKEATLTILAQAVQSINYKTAAWVDSFGSEPVIEYVNIDGEDVALEVTEEATTLQDLIDAYNNASQIVTFSTNSSSTQLSDSTTCGWFADAELTEPLTPSANNDYSNILIADHENFYTAMATDLTTLEERFTFATDTSAGTCTVSAKTYSGAEIIDIVLPRTYSDCLLTTVGDNESSSNASIKNMKLSSGITTLSNKAFYKFTALKGVTLPNSITSFGTNTFSYCSKLESLKIPTGLKVVQGINYCNSLSRIEVPEGVTDFNIGDCSSLRMLNISSSVSHISIGTGCSDLYSIDVASDNANYSSVNGALFDKNKTILFKYPVGRVHESYTIPSTVSNIASHAFYSSKYLISVIMDNNVNSIGDYAFANCKEIQSIEISNGLTGIGQRAFYNCESLTNIKIPSGVTSIPTYAFYNCNSLVSVENLSQLTKVEANAFYNCEQLGSIEFNEGLKTIGDSAFYNCYKLASVTIPYGTTSIGKNAFNTCILLKNIDIPKSVTSIGKGAFYDCRALEKITLPFSDKDFDYFFTSSSNVLCIPTALKEVEVTGGTEIGYGTFTGYNAIEKLTIPYVGSSDGTYTNFGCIFGSSSNENDSTHIPSTLKDVTILGGTIAKHAFNNCSINTLELGSDVTNIGQEAIYCCSSLKKITIPFVGDGTGAQTSFVYIIGGPYPTLHEVVITGGDIETQAFWSCTTLQTVTLPSTATKIGQSAFSRCTSLTTVNIPYGPTKIGYNAFEGCSSLKNIEIPESVTSIGGFAFDGCKFLGSIEIPDSVIEIGVSAFRGCTYLDIILPKNITVIDQSLFADCTYLESVILPEGITSIGTDAFENCTSLSSIIIPEAVTEIKISAFNNCSALQTVNFTGSKDVWNNITIDSNNTDLTEATIVYNYGLTEEVITPATCMAEGTAKQTNYYGTIKEVAIPKTDHTLNEHKVCTVCGATINVVYLTIDGTQIAVNAPQNATTLQDVINAYNLVNTDKQINDSTTCGWFLNSSLSKVITPTAIDNYSNILLEDYDNFYTCWVTDISVLETIVTFSGNSVSFAKYLNTHRDIVLPRVYNGNLITTIAEGKTYIYITSLVIPSGVVTIAKNAFWGFEYLTSFVVPNSVTSIGVSAFRKCNRLQTITLPFIGTNATTTTRDEMLFGYIFGDSSFTSMVQSGSLVPTTLKEVIFTQATKIGRYAFYGSTITTITLPKTLTEIAAGAFYNCTALATINYEGSESDWANVTKTNSYIPDTVVYKYGCVI